MVRTEFLISMWSVSRQGMEIEWLKRRVRVEVALHSRGTDPEQIRDSPRADEKVSSTRPTPRQGQSTTTPRCRSGYHRRTGSQRCRRHRGSAVVQSRHTPLADPSSACALTLNALFVGVVLRWVVEPDPLQLNHVTTTNRARHISRWSPRRKPL